MKTKTTHKNAATRGPYDTSKRTSKRKGAVDTNPFIASSSTPDCLPKPPTAPRKDMILFRDACLDVIRRFYPNTKPRSDWDIMQLGSQTKRADNPEALYAWLDQRYASSVQILGREVTDNSVKTVLDTYMEHSGKKPVADDPRVLTRPIPDSKYSIRLFPGSLSSAEYCMDFVDSATGQPVNLPFEHELWSVPNPDTPWLTMPMVGKLRSAERSHGIQQEDIRPGEEKYFLRDGQTCVLMRPGKRPVRFTVPVRRRPGLQEATEAVDVLDFPKLVDP
ncbi:hypothetical protein PYCCODRAFT_1474250 [Trametes coccinea BRFM310]|uniref:Uncharacterized protein n=1 Tax=Trametes coccinea (strain BRFM310) TaxID=1353009 RepID=A0A1Y2J1Q9_TRAC3|nr:hypothetical protein PYCCODRAFT_1474250 [Trametes coccinea BRFM310]